MPSVVFSLASLVVIDVLILLFVSVSVSQCLLSYVLTSLSRIKKSWSQKKATSDNSLPHVSSQIPIIGHILHLQQHSAQYIHNLISKTKAPLFTINILNKYIVIAHPSTERAFSQHASDTGLAQIVGLVGRSLFGLKKSSIDFITEFDPRPQHRHEFLNTDSLQRLSKISSAYAFNQVTAEPAIQEVNLGRWLFGLGVSATACAVWGEENPWHMDQKFMDHYCILTECFDLLGRPFPQLTARQAYKSREFLLTRLRQFHKHHRAARTQSTAHKLNPIAMSDPDWENNPDYFGVELLSSIGLLDTGNTLIVWMVWHLLAQPRTFKVVVDEVRALGLVEGQPDIRHIHATCPHLAAAWHETLRLHMTGVPRIVRRAFDITMHPSGSVPLKEGDIVMLPMYAFNRDAGSWGSHANCFAPERFFDNSGRLSSSLLRKVKGFGVVGNLCPSRRFGTETSMAVVVNILREYHIERVDGGSFQHPTPRKGLTLGFQLYNGDVRVRLKKPDSYIPQDYIVGLHAQDAEKITR